MGRWGRKVSSRPEERGQARTLPEALWAPEIRPLPLPRPGPRPWGPSAVGGPRLPSESVLISQAAAASPSALVPAGSCLEVSCSPSSRQSARCYLFSQHLELLTGLGSLRVSSSRDRDKEQVLKARKQGWSQRHTERASTCLTPEDVTAGKCSGK